MRTARSMLAVGVVVFVLTTGPGAAAADVDPPPSPIDLSSLADDLTPIALPLPVAPDLAMVVWPLVSFRAPAPITGMGTPWTIADRYIVLFSPDIPSHYFDSAMRAIGQWGGEVHFMYRGAVMGFAATLPAAIVDRFAHHPFTALIEADQVVFGSTVQSSPPWGLDRIDQRARPLNDQYAYNATGNGVTAYVLDTGIRATHTQFGSRVLSGVTAINDGNGTSDCYGHGTHVAGTIGGRTYGVAKQVQLVPVRVLDCNNSGTSSAIIAGINWVTQHHRSPAVANMSLGSSASGAVDEALRTSIASGVTYVAAAGNSNQDACGISPARVPNAITVGATAQSDARASFSNWGRCLDLFAPGERIESSWYTSDNAAGTLSGTSMAAPHVTGAVALYLQRNPNASPATVHNAIVNRSTTNVVTDAAGSPNRLLFSQP